VPKTNPIILLTRPAKQAGAFRKLLGKRVDVIESPVIKINFLKKKLNLQDYSAVIFTSQNAVDAVVSEPFGTGFVAFAVGERTAVAARSIGLSTCSANGNADRLVDTIFANPPGGRMLLIRGKYSTGRIEERLKSGGLETDSVVVYEQVEKQLTPDAVAILRGDRPVVLPLFSPRSAMILSKAVREAGGRAPLILTAISEAALNAWDGPSPVAASVASEPTKDAMAAEILRRIGRTP